MAVNAVSIVIGVVGLYNAVIGWQAGLFIV
jgi:hypothetical protein